MSLRNATAKLLARRKNGLTVRQIIEVLADRGIWTPKTGKTPQATLLAILHSDLATDAPTFKRVSYVENGRRGVMWTLNR